MIDMINIQKKPISRMKHFLFRLKGTDRKQPSDIIYFVDNICNLKCKHCFLGYSLDHNKNDLTIDEIKNIVHSFKKPLSTLILTGGEPVLRSDLITICEIFDNNPGVKTFLVTTNGFDTNKVISFVKSFLEKISAKLIIQISLDGVSQTHNDIRENQKSFENALFTAEQLIKLSKDKNLFEVCFMMTLHSKNYNEIYDVFKISQTYAIPLGFEVMRGASYFKTNDDFWENANPRSKDVQPLSIEQLKSLSKTIENIYFNNTKYIIGETLLKESLACAYRLTKWYFLLEIIEHKLQFRCSAGNKTGVLYSDGNVSLCELTNTIGSLRENDYDFKNIWKSKESNNMRQKINKCYCTHGCFIYDSMFSKYNTFIRIFKFFIICYVRNILKKQTL